MRFAALGTVVLGCALVAGCTATTAVERARQSFQEAGRVGTEAVAPYDYYAAEAYLGLAEKESAECDWRAAKDFADRSVEFSTTGAAKVEGGAQ